MIGAVERQPAAHSARDILQRGSEVALALGKGKKLSTSGPTRNDATTSGTCTRGAYSMTVSSPPCIAGRPCPSRLHRGRDGSVTTSIP